MFLSVAWRWWAGTWRVALTTQRRQRAIRSPSRSGVASRLQHVLNKYYVDEAYDYVFTGRRNVGDVRLGVMGAGRGVFVVRLPM